MRPLDPADIEEIFRHLTRCISPDKYKILSALDNVLPAEHEHQDLEWRYRLAGFVEGLYAADILNFHAYEKLVEQLFSRA